MIDVHLPHGKLLGVKDFFLHLFTITIGLLIALSLEGWVEHEHHQHLAHEAESGLRAEISTNEHEMGHRRQQITDQQTQAQINLKTLAEMQANPQAKHGPLRIGGGMETFDNMSWKTAQTTGAISYMPYKDTQSFSDIYLMQDELYKLEMQLVEEETNAASLLISHPADDWVPTPEQADLETDRIGRMQIRLIVLGNELDGLDKTYQRFES